MLLWLLVSLLDSWSPYLFSPPKSALSQDAHCNVQDASCKMYFAKFKLQDTSCKIYFAKFKCKMYTEKFKLQDARPKVQDERLKCASYDFRFARCNWQDLSCKIQVAR